MATMKAVRIHDYGGPEVLLHEEVPRPGPAADEVLIHVQAAGVNPVDWKIREGFGKEWFGHQLPLTLGCDLAGIVESTGDKVLELKPGDAVLTSGQKVLIHAAAGGVGHLAVQLAKAKGAFVIGTVSAKNIEFARGLGVDEVIDYRETRFEDVVNDADVVFDTIGEETQERSFKVLKRGGGLVSAVSEPPEDACKKHGVRGAMVAVQPNADQLAEISALIESDQLRPTIATTMPLENARQTHELSQSGHTRGKIILTV